MTKNCVVCGRPVTESDWHDIALRYLTLLEQADVFGVDMLTEDEQTLYNGFVHAGCYPFLHHGEILFGVVEACPNCGGTLWGDSDWVFCSDPVCGYIGPEWEDESDNGDERYENEDEGAYEDDCLVAEEVGW